MVLTKTELRNSFFPLLLPAAYQTPYDTVSFYFYQFVEPAGIPCLDVTSSKRREQFTGHYVLVEVVEQSVENIG